MVLLGDRSRHGASQMIYDVEPDYDQSCRRDNKGVCEYCGRPLGPWDWFICPQLLNPHFREPDELEIRRPMGLGDYTESLLKRIGVTQNRYVEAKKALGLAPTCNCAERIAWLNRAGHWWARQPKILPDN